MPEPRAILPSSRFRRRPPADEPGEPPATVLRDVHRAAERYDELEAGGRRLHFDLEAGELRIELHDLDGNVLAQVTPAEALDLAAGDAD